MQFLFQDFRYALRQLRKAPGFTLTSILTLALGIGATTAIFTLVYDVLLKPLPYSHPEQLVTMEERVAEWSSIYPTLPVSANHFMLWQRQNHSFGAMALLDEGTIPLGGGTRPAQVMALWATPGIFSVLGMHPEMGRGFNAQEGLRGYDNVAVLTDDLWHEQFGGDPGILGRTISLDGIPYSVIGVMPRSFHAPSLPTMYSLGGSARQAPIGVLLPLSFSVARLAEQMGDLNYFGLARRRPRVTLAAANSDLNALQRRISASLPANQKATLSAVVNPFQEMLVGNNRKPLTLLLAAVAGLLLVGCLNITNLLLSRALGRRQQLAVAAALGANRREMLRMAMRETTLLAAAGGGLGIWLAALLVPLMQRYLPPALDFRGPLHLDWAGAGCAVLLSVASTLLAGAAPAWLSSRMKPQEVLHSRLASESRGSKRLRRILVAAEVAVSVALVITTCLLIASFVRLMNVNRGFTAAHTITVTVDLPSAAYHSDEQRARFYREVLGRISGLPGVEHAAFSSVLPLNGSGWGEAARVVGDIRPWTKLPLETMRSVSPQYFSAINLPLIAGSAFMEDDYGKRLAIVSQKAAESLWPGRNPLGQQLAIGDSDEKPFTVIGVTPNARTVSLATPDPMMIYVPYWYLTEPTGGLLIHTHRDASEIATLLRRTIWGVDRSVSIPTIRSLGGVIADSVANRRFEMDLLLLFAVSALLLAGLGVYGVVTYSVVQRQREIGLRFALGAQRANIYRLVLRDGLTPVLVGAAIGIAIAFGFAHVIGSLLFEVSPYNPVLVIAAVGVLIVVGAAACLLPARRAAAVDPMHALRAE